jgi:dTDP-4-dehydrorhamnose 3,5-epimerase-like enzyme
MGQPAIVELTAHHDGRGTLAVVESWDDLPFTPARLFSVSGVPDGVWRGGHASLSEHELLVCVAGSCTVRTEWKAGRDTFVLDRPDRGLYLPPMVWMTYRLASPATALVVLASNAYDPTDRITDHAAFVARTAPAP